uniref:Cytochrome P450 92B63 n=1 Tax=Callicarpa americana TaxID=204211 RepID=A0A9Y1LQ33_CALAM|nr:cytochrome P450 92B63 [Callicarpa americana]
MKNSWAVLLALLHIAALAFISKIIFKWHPRRKHPPGPKPWPIIGNLNLLGSVPHQSLHYLSQKYGEIMLLKFGKFPVVVASSPEMAKQFLKVHDIFFASRPAFAGGKYLSYNYSGMTWAPYGPHWRQTRKIFHSEVFNAKRLESFEQIRIEERRCFLSRLLSMSGNPVMLRDHLSRHTLSTISRMVLTDKYYSESEEENNIVKMDELRGMVDEWFLLFGAFNIGDWIPWLSFLDLQGYVKKMKALHKKLDRFNNHVIDDHLARRAAEKDFTPEDVVDALLQQAEDPNLEVKLTRDCVKALIDNLLVGGIDTSATTVEWAVHEILKQPHIIIKAKEELDRVIGRNRWVEENDFSQLPYIDAIIMESFRLHPLTTLLAPHYATEDCKVAGYDISKGTTVLINTWSIGRDPNSWDAPEEFLPQRFMGKEIDMLGNNFALLPFGSGRRRCPGYSLGLKIVRTTLTNLIHGFDLKLVQGMRPEDICMEELYGLTTHPKQPLSIIMEPTLPAYLY